MSDDAKPDTSEAAGTDWLATLQACVDGTNALTPTGERELLKLLRALLAERDAALSARDDAIRRLGDAARDAGRWRGISEGKDIVVKQLEAERDALRAQLAAAIERLGAPEKPEGGA